jgi:hypothetical protein
LLFAFLLSLSLYFSLSGEEEAAEGGRVAGRGGGEGAEAKNERGEVHLSSILGLEALVHQTLSLALSL